MGKRARETEGQQQVLPGTEGLTAPDNADPAGPLADGAEETSEDVPDTFDRKLAEWVTTEISEGDTPVVWLYRYTGDRATKEVCHKGSDILDAHEVGLRFGAGEYEILVQIPRSKLRPGVRPFKSYKFRCAKHYDDLAKQRREVEDASRAMLERNVAAAAVAPAAPSNGHGLLEGLSVLEGVIKMLTPLLTKREDPMSPAVMAQMYGEVNRTMARSTIETHKMLTESLRDQLRQAEDGGDGEDGEDGEDGQDPMQGIYELVAQYLPKLIGDTPAGNVLAATVRKAPEFKKLKGNRADFSKLVAYLDGQHGKDKVDKALTKLGVNRPE